MPEQYVATDKRTGTEITVTGAFPPHPDDRVRIARTTTLFTRLMSTLLGKEESERRMGFRAVETQLELADALIRQDLGEVRRLVRETMQSLGVTDEQLEDLARQLRDLSGVDESAAADVARALGLDPTGGDAAAPHAPDSDGPAPDDANAADAGDADPDAADSGKTDAGPEHDPEDRDAPPVA